MCNFVNELPPTSVCLITSAFTFCIPTLIFEKSQNMEFSEIYFRFLDSLTVLGFEKLRK